MGDRKGSPSDPRSTLPSVHAVVAEVRRHDPGLDEARVVRAARSALADARRAVGPAGVVGTCLAEVAGTVRAAVSGGEASSLSPVINATGVIIHTNLGRAPLGDRAIEAVVAAAGYVPIELDLDTGRRGRRTTGLDGVLSEATGAADALVVNNAAAALILVLSALAAPGRVAVGRGELVEIGGGFRLPEVMSVSGSALCEVGTTNRTYARDYAAVLDEVSLLLSVHQSNFAQVGFVGRPSVSELSAVARSGGIPLVVDAGSGLLGRELPEEVEVRAALSDGADLVIFSGDKLLGGPQAGCVVGDADLLRRCRRHPLFRALRVSKLVAAALEATLVEHLLDAGSRLPVWRFYDRSPAELQRRCDELASQVPGGTVTRSAGRLGGGSTPTLELPGPVVTVPGIDATSLLRALRRSRPVVLARISRDAVVVDLRTVEERDDAVVAAVLRRAVEGCRTD